MLFQHTLPMVLAGKKTQTRRVISLEEVAIRGKNNQIIAVTVNGREKWRVGNTYAVQPGRGKSQIGRIAVTAIKSERVGRISTSDAIAEGFTGRKEFLQVWQQIHGEGSENLRVWVVQFEIIALGVDIKEFLKPAPVGNIVKV